MTDKNIASSELTGGAGSTYESRVAAVYLAYLLIEGGARGIISGKMDKVAVQRASIDAPLDDLKITALRNDSANVKYDAQIKRSLVISAAKTNTDFRDIIGKAWDTIEADDFNNGIDRVGAITEDIATKSYRNFRSLTDIARNSHNGEEFTKKVSVPRASGEPTRKILADIKTILKEKLSQEPSDDEIWRLLKHFILIRVEIMGDGAADKEHAILHLRQYTPEPHRSLDLFDALDSIARDMSATSGSLDRNSLLERLQGRFSITFPELAIANILPNIRDAAQSDLMRFIRDAASPHHKVLLGLETEKDGERNIIEYLQVIEMLNEQGNIVIEAEPGTGKSTTLLQLAEKILAEIGDNIPIILPLPQLAVSQQSIIDAILVRHSFSSLGQEHFRALAEEGALVLLCDGWNEVSLEQRSFVRQEIEKFTRDYPNNSIVFATRPNTLNVPLRKATFVYLSPLTKYQQNEIVASILGVEGAKLLEHARKIPGLSGILKIPFYLNVLCTTGREGVLPESKEEVINQFIKNHENQPRHQESLKNVLEEEQHHYLSYLGEVLTRENTTAISKSDLKKVLSEVGKKLKNEGLIKDIPTPHETIAVLHDHHVLVCHPDEEHYDFQHQQFQEWYASFHVENMIVDAAANVDGARVALYETIINYVSWEESLMFAIERLSRKNTEGMEAVGELVLKTLGIDPMLAAEMIARSPDDVWNYIKETTFAFVKKWHKDGKKDRALDFMVLSGQPDFAHDLWAVIEESEENDRMLGLRRINFFDPDVLGDDAKNKIMNLQPRIRRSLLYDIAAEGSYKSLEFVANILRDEPDYGVYVDILGILDFRGADTHIAPLLDTASDEVWAQLVRHRSLDILSQTPYKSRLLEEKRKLIVSLSPGHQRILHMMHLDEEGADDYSDQLVSEVLEVKFSDNHAEYHILKDLAQRYPEKLSKGIIQCICNGKKVNNYAYEFFLPDTTIDQDILLKAILNQSNKSSFGKEVAQLLSVESIDKLLDEMLSTKEKAMQLDYDNAKGLWEYSRHLDHILEKVSLDKLATSILNRDVIQPAEIAELAEILSSWSDTYTWQAKLELEPDTKNALIERTKEWATSTIQHPDTTRSNMVNVGLLIGCLGAHQLLPLLKMLLDRELELFTEYQRITKKAFEEGGNPPEDVLREARTGHSLQYRRAFEGFSCPELPEILLDYLKEPEFRVEAGFSLLHYVQKRSGVDRKFEHYPNYSKVAQKRSLVLAGESPAEVDPIAANILDCVDALLLEEDKQSLSDASKLAIASAQMKYGRRLDTFHNVLQSVGSVTLARILIQNGEEVPVDYLKLLIEKREKEVLGEKWRSQDNWYRIEEVVELLAFTEQPNIMVDHFKKHREHYTQAWKLRRLISALGYSTSPKAVNTLREFQNAFPELVGLREWYSSLGQLASEEAAKLLVEVMFDATKIPHLQKESWGIREVFRKLLGKYPDVKKDLIERLRSKDAVVQRQFVASMTGIHEGIEEDLFLAIFEATAPTEKQIFSLLSRSIEGLAIEKHPVDGSDSSYNLVPSDSTLLRKKLFQHAIGESPLSGIANDMLNEIDRVRDEYGHPPSEPRHPDIKSAKAFPLEAQFIWDTE